MTRNDARAAFAKAGLSTAALKVDDIAALWRSIDAELRASGLENATLRLDPDPRILADETGRVISADLQCCSERFRNSQAVTFAKNGFIGFAGWADDTFLTPILNGFTSWMATMSRHHTPPTVL